MVGIMYFKIHCAKTTNHDADLHLVQWLVLFNKIVQML